MNTKFTPEFIAEQRELLDEFFPREELARGSGAQSWAGIDPLKEYPEGVRRSGSGSDTEGYAERGTRRE